jgi:nucleotide-binding universal stress UspA family protein
VKRILIALDASPVSIHAARVATRLFQGVPDVEFLAISVANVPVAWAGDPTGGAYALPESVWQELDDQARDETGVVERAHEAGITQVEPVADMGDPVDRIVAAAEEHDVALVVVGAHDKGFLRKLVDPSVSHGVLRHTHRPVLVVHEEHRAAAT